MTLSREDADYFIERGRDLDMGSYPLGPDLSVDVVTLWKVIAVLADRIEALEKR